MEEKEREEGKNEREGERGRLDWNDHHPGECRKRLTPCQCGWRFLEKKQTGRKRREKVEKETRCIPGLGGRWAPLGPDCLHKDWERG